jgi:hypothetical protein
LEQYDKYYEQTAQLAMQVAQARTEFGKNDSILNNHLRRVELMLEYVSKSIRQQQNEIRENKRSDYRLTEELRRFFQENAGKGVFVY